jgi:hypothetical protein
MKLSIGRVVSDWRDVKHFDAREVVFAKNTNGPGRRCALHLNTPLAEKAFAAFGIKMDAPEPMFGHMIGNQYADGAFVHQHKDFTQNGFAHVRCNWLVKKPPVGGHPVLDDEVIAVNEGDLWLCLSSIELHGTTPIYGGERLVYSFGAFVKLEQLQPLLGPLT